MSSQTRAGVPLTEWGALDLDGGPSFGVTPEGRPFDPASHYRLRGRSWPVSSLDDGVTGTDRSFSFDVSNNRVLASVGQDGFITRLAASYGLVPVYQTGLPGVFVDKDHDYVEGRIGIDVRAEGEPLVTADLVDNLVPRSRSVSGGLEVTRVTFAPVVPDAPTEAPSGVILVTRVANRGDVPQRVETRLVSTIDWALGDTRPVITGLDGTTVEGMDAGFDLAPGETRVLAVAVVYSRCDAEAARRALEATSAARQLERTLSGLRGRYGVLSIPDDPYYADLVIRQAELARQVMLFDDEGRHAGSFWGSDANQRQDVWMLDLYYSMLPMAQFAPELCRATVDFFVQYGLPPAAWGNDAAADEGHPLPGVSPVSHSIGNATAAIALAGALVSATGDVASFAQDATFLAYGKQVAQLLLSSRAPGETLFPSVFISDGPSRGDFHTGSNVKAWYALRTMATILGQVPAEEERAAELAKEADRVREAIYALCQGEGRFGAELFEGVYRDGAVVPGHDGEETDLTLASFYRLTDVDDPGVIHHALRAFTTDNPYFVPATGGISWWDFDWHGPTFPAFVHALAGAASEKESLAGLAAIRSRTDMDGSVWWWPHLHEDADKAAVLRGPGKCGWAAGALVSKFVHDLLGLRPDASGSALEFRPFLPWDSFEWQGAVLGATEFDASYLRDAEAVTASVRNNTSRNLEVRFGLLVPEGSSPRAFLLDGADVRERARLAGLFGRSVVMVATTLRPGASTSFRLELQPYEAGHQAVNGRTVPAA